MKNWVKNNSFAFWISLSLIMLVNLFLFFSDFFFMHQPGQQYQVYDPDSLLFLRYFEQSLLLGEDLKIDNYGTFPHSVQLNFPPFHLSLLLVVTDFFYLLFPDSSVAPEYVIGILPPLAGWFSSVLIVWFIWKRTQNKALSLIVSFCFIPGYISGLNYWFMRVDYHFLNALFIWVFILSLAQKIDTGKQIYSFLLLGAATLFMFTWPGTPLFFGIVVFYGAVIWLRGDNISGSYLDETANTLIAASALVALFLIKKGISAVEISEFGWFQPLVVLAGGIFLKFLSRLSFASFKSATSRLLFLSLFSGCCMGLIFAFFPNQISAGVNFFSAGDRLMESITELRPLVNPRTVVQNPRQFSRLISVAGLTIFFLPFFILSDQRLFSGGGTVVKDFCLIILCFSFYSLRFFRWLSAGIGLITGVSIYSMWLSFFRQNGRLAKLKYSLVFVVIFIAHFSMNYPFFFRSVGLSAGTVDSLEWIKRNTPETSGYSDFNRPEYCFFNYWDKGNYINYYAKRPTISNNTVLGYRKMSEIFSAQSESRAIDLCRKYQVRYLFIEDVGIDNKQAQYLRQYSQRPNIPEDVYVNFPDFNYDEKEADSYERTFFFWLERNCGVLPSDHFAESASCFRLVYSSEQRSRFEGPEILIFEFVEGARIIGKADKNVEVNLSLHCVFDKTEIMYKRVVLTDENGEFSIRVPYRNSYQNGRVKTDAIYKLSFFLNGKPVKAKATVTEKDITNAGEVFAEVL